METVDTLIVGAGVVGLAIAAQLSKNLSNVLIIDKNTAFGEETSSRNSEVIHAGIYYPENTLKSKLCVEGKELLYQYCMNRNIPFSRIGKLIVATDNEQDSLLSDILCKAKANHVLDLKILSRRKTLNIEPQVNATSALYSPSTGIIDSHSFMQSLLAETEANGALFSPLTELMNVEVIKNGFIVKVSCEGEAFTFQCRNLINSGGLHADKVARCIRSLPEEFIPKVNFCRGHYFSYSGVSPFKHLVYPVPSENGLGIHATLDMSGQLKFGPDTEFINEIDYTVPELLKGQFVRSIKNYFPLIDGSKLQPAYAGIRPKLNKNQFNDFIIQDETQHGIKGLINLFGIESPGLTASLAIANLVNKALEI